MSKILSKTPLKTSNIDPDAWLGFFVMLVVVSFLSPFHSHIGYDFLAGAFKFILVAFGLLGFFALSLSTKTPPNRISLSVLTWGLLAVWLICQTIFMDIVFPDSMIFVVGALITAAMTGVAGSNVGNKRQFLDIVFCGAYVAVLGSFVIQLMQILGVQWVVDGFLLTQLAGNNRFFANLMQPNHLAYVFVLGLCGVVYHQDVIKGSRLKKYALWLLMAVIVAGLALTRSRAGVVLSLSVFFVYVFAQSHTLKQKSVSFVKYLCGFMVVYLAVSWWTAYSKISDIGGSLGGVGRLAEDGNRINIAKQALAVIYDHPIVGVGYGNYRQASDFYLERFAFSENIINTHNFITMIWAEMGVIGLLCLIPIVFVLVHTAHTKHSPHSAAALAFVSATVLYSWVEFPLWYFGFLVLFALFLGLVEQKHITLSNQVLSRVIRFACLPLLLIGALSMEYYLWQFSKNQYSVYHRYAVLDPNPIEAYKVSKGSAIFGLRMYNDLILANQISAENTDNYDRRRIFEGAAHRFGSPYHLFSYGQMLAYDGQYDKASDYFKFSCLRSLDVKENCDVSQSELKELSKKEPEYFAKLYEEFLAWRFANPDKTGLNDEK